MAAYAINDGLDFDNDNPYMSLYTRTVGIGAVSIYNKVNELYNKYNAALMREQSTTNKLLGGMAIDLTGIGGMQIMQVSAEKRADKSAEESMQAYMQTFACDYGMGRNIKGGDTGIELPSGNDFVSLVKEYKELAADLNMRKIALGKSPGIESEVIIDSAFSGLYNNTSKPGTGGIYTSVYRAIADEQGAAAAGWEKQKDGTLSKEKIGTAATLGGVIGGANGNFLLRE